MKQLLIKLMVLLATIGLVSCSTQNTQSENTGIGAVTGAVVGGLAGSAFGGGVGKAVAVGAGAIAGALVGGSIGHNMDSSDRQNTYNTLETTPTHKANRWKNKKTNSHYTVIPTSNTVSYNGNQNCRSYTAITTHNGDTQTSRGMACKQADGTWTDTTTAS